MTRIKSICCTKIDYGENGLDGALIQMYPIYKVGKDEIISIIVGSEVAKQFEVGRKYYVDISPIKN